MSSRTLFWFLCGVPSAFAASDSALALEGSKVFAIGSNSLVVKTEGRKGTRVFTPDESADYSALVEGQEKAAATTESTNQQKLDRCMASWDIKTHITKANWRKICERELSDGGL
jgi:hypothetical protein